MSNLEEGAKTFLGDIVDWVHKTTQTLSLSDALTLLLDRCQLPDHDRAFDAMLLGVYDRRRSTVVLLPDRRDCYIASSYAPSFWMAARRMELVETRYGRHGVDPDDPQGGFIAYLFRAGTPVLVQNLADLRLTDTRSKRLRGALHGTTVIGVPLFYFGHRIGVAIFFQTQPHGDEYTLKSIAEQIGYVIAAPVEAESRTQLGYNHAGYILGHEHWHLLAAVQSGLREASQRRRSVKAAWVSLATFNQLLDEFQDTLGDRLDRPPQQLLTLQPGEPPYDPVEKVRTWHRLKCLPGFSDKATVVWTTSRCLTRIREPVLYITMTNAFSNAVDSAQKESSGRTSLRVEFALKGEYLSVTILDHGADWGTTGLADDFPYHVGGWHIRRYVEGGFGGRVSLIRKGELRGDWKGLRLDFPREKVVYHD